MSRRNRKKKSLQHIQRHKDHYNFINKNMIEKRIKHFIDHDSEWWIDYDERGNIIHKKIIYKTPELKGRILEFWIEYNENGNETHFVRNDGFECWCMYNNKGNISSYWDVTGYNEKYTYYRGGVVYRETSLGFKEKFYYSERNVPLTRNYFN